MNSNSEESSMKQPNDNTSLVQGVALIIKSACPALGLVPDVKNASPIAQARTAAASGANVLLEGAGGSLILEPQEFEQLLRDFSFQFPVSIVGDPPSEKDRLIGIGCTLRFGEANVREIALTSADLSTLSRFDGLPNND
jgi:hypothetical protein